MEDMNNEEEFLLKWNNHQSNLISVFKDWLCDESFVDVTLVCGGEAVVGHKVVLAACSPLLNRILHDNPCRHPVVILNDVCSTDMRALLKFIYQGEVSVSQSELPSFLRTADNLQIKGLAEGREKDDKKRKEKDGDAPSSARKRRKTDSKVSSTHHLQTQNKLNQDPLSSSPKMQKHCSPNREKFSSCNSHKSGAVHLNSINNKVLHTQDASMHNLETECDQSSESFLQEHIVVKTEPLEYMGEVVWQEGKSPIKRESDAQGQRLKGTTEASSSNSLRQTHFSSIELFGAIPETLETLNAGHTDFLQKSLDCIHSEERKMDEEGKAVPLASDEINQTTILTKRQRGVDSLPLRHDQDVTTPSSIARPSYSITTPSRSLTVPLSEEQFNSYDLLNANYPAKAPFGAPEGQPFYNLNGSTFSCTCCPFKSRNPYTFNRHLRIHLGTKEFKCTACEYATSRKDSLIRHFRVKHIAAESSHFPDFPGEEN